MRKLISFILSVVIIFSVVSTTGYCQINAAPIKKKNKAMIAYKNWLSQSDCVGFRVFDINQDGTKELLTTYDGYGKNVFNINIYTYKSNKVVSCNNQSEYSMFGFNHNKATKRLHGSGGGGGSEEKWYYTLTKAKKLKKVILSKIENGYNYSTGTMTYKYYFNNKEITQKQYNKKNKNWSKNLQAFKFYKLTDANIKKYVK